VVFVTADGAWASPSIPVIVALLWRRCSVPPARMAQQQRGLPRALADDDRLPGRLLTIAAVVALLAAPVAAAVRRDTQDAPGSARAPPELGAYLADLPLGLNEQQQIQRQIDGLDDRIRENQTRCSPACSPGRPGGGPVPRRPDHLPHRAVLLRQGRARDVALARRPLPGRAQAALDDSASGRGRCSAPTCAASSSSRPSTRSGSGLALFAIGVPARPAARRPDVPPGFVPVVGSIVAGVAAALVALAFEGPGGAARRSSR
jgi:hypothetical protein